MAATSLYPPIVAPAEPAFPRAAVRLWLIAVAALVVAMIVVGGLTRLTGSGLSITEWQPILGAVPPLNEADWQAAFAKYREIPQYKSVNAGMTLGEFQFIFWWEWAHRFLGRFIGLAMALPLLGFWLSGRLPRMWTRRLFGVTALIGVQGAVGWYMVRSGLADRIDVSPYRLALHLSIAFLILGCLVWLVCELGSDGEHRQAVPARLRRGATWLAALIFSQVALGGLVAGLKAGRAFNTWPLMDGRLIPDGIAALEPWWLNLTENIATVQFDHRMTAYLIVLLVVWHVLACQRAAAGTRFARSALLLGAAVLSQTGIGIATVVHAVPLGLCIAHQTLAALLFIVAIVHVHASGAEHA